MTTVYCDVSYCEYNDDGICSREKIDINEINCTSNKICRTEEDEEK